MFALFAAVLPNSSLLELSLSFWFGYWQINKEIIQEATKKRTKIRKKKIGEQFYIKKEEEAVGEININKNQNIR